MSRRPARPVVMFVLLCVATSTTLFGCSWFAGDDTAKFRDGVAAHDDTGARVVAPGHDGAEVRFSRVKNAPAAALMSFAERIGDPVDIAPPAGLAAAEVRLSFAPGKDLPKPVAGSQAPTVANAFIAVLSAEEGAWQPLQTTYDGNREELVAQTPHFSQFARFSVRPGRWSLPNPVAAIGSGLDAIGGGLAAVGTGIADSVEVVYDATTSGVEALARTVSGGVVSYLSHLRDEMFGLYPGDKHVDCGNGLDPSGKKLSDDAPDNLKPSGNSVPARGWQAQITGSLADKLRACVVEDPAGPERTRWLRMENYLGAPLSLFPPRNGLVSTEINDYDIAMIDDPLFLLGRYFLSFKTISPVPIPGTQTSVVAGARGSQLEILTDRTPFTVNVYVNWFTVALDLAMVLLSVLAPSITVATKWMLRAELRAISRLDVATGELLTLEKIKFEFTQFEREEKLTPQAIKNAGEIVDLYNCLRGGFNALVDFSGDDLVDAVRGCIATVFHKGAFLAPLSGIAANLKTYAEVRDLVRHGDEQATITVRPPVTENQLGKVNWERVAGPLIGCSETEPDLRRKQTHDITGDRVPDTFIVMDCYTGNDRWPSSLLVYDGASSPSTPRLLGKLLTGEDDVYLNRGGCLQFNGKSVTVRARTYRDTDPAGNPTLLVTQTSRWTGTTFERGYKNVSQALPTDLVAYPGC